MFSFGAPAPAPAAGGFSFGAPAPAPAAGGFSFGAPAPAPAAGGFSFGAPAPAPAAGGFSFGAPTPAPAAGGFSFGAPAPAPAAGGFALAPAPAPFSFGQFSAPPAPAPAPPVAPKDPQDAIIERVVPVLAKYAPQDAGPLADTKRLLQGLYKSDPYTYRFKTIAYNVRDPQAAYTRPPLLTQQEWDAEISAHGTDDSCTPPLPLLPVSVDGFEGLNARMDDQDSSVTEFSKLAEQLLASVHTTRLAVDRSVDTLARLRDKQVALGRRLLAVCTKVEGVITRGKMELPVEVQLRQQLVALRDKLTRHDAVAARLDALLRAQRAREEREAAAGAAAGGVATLSDVEGLKRQLEAQRGGIEQLVTVVKRDARDLRIIESNLEHDAARSKASDARHSLLGYGPPAY